MKFLRTYFDNIKSSISKSKYPKLKYIVNGMDTFLFVPNDKTPKRGGVHIKDGIDLKRTMFTVVIALLPALLFGMYNIGFQHFEQMVALKLVDSYTFFDAFLHGLNKTLPLIIVSYGVGLGIEFLFCYLRGHEINEGYLVTGLLIPMIVPVSIPLWMLALAVVFAVIIGKEVFGGTGMNIFNPALIARAFLFFAYPTYMSGNIVWVSEAMNIDAMSGETILGQLAQSISPLHMPNVDKVYSAMDMFMGYIPGSIGETSIFAILIGAFILIFTGIGSWRIMLSSLVGASFIGFVFNLFSLNSLMEFPWWQHLLVGGFGFGVVFMATDPVSAAQTNKGKWIYGFLIGFFAITIRVFNPAYPEGIMLAILLLNTFAPTIDHFVVQSNINKRKKRLVALNS